MIVSSKAAEIIELLKGQLIVSCQDYVEVMVEAAVRGGAAGLRINSPVNVSLALNKTKLPIVACNKIRYPNSPVYITPSIRAALALIKNGATIVALDCTQRHRVREQPSEIIAAIHENGALAVADLSCFQDAVYSIEAGADILATTLTSKFDADFVRLLSAFDLPVLAEGGINTPELAKEAIDAGAWAICVGTAITKPHLITKNFKDALSEQHGV